MTRFIPANAETREFPAAAVVAYCYQSDRGPAFVAYKGRQSKPARFYAFPSEEHRDANLADFVKQQTEAEDWKRARRETGHGLTVGDIVYSCWGYEQTNVDFSRLSACLLAGRPSCARSKRKSPRAGPAA